MVKNLRSLIHEKIPFDLRVKIDLLSRRRDIVNEEKHQELIKMLREFNIGDVVQLGPGTNRYAIRLDGFVVKFATDHDGKIDNMKEFKMAKRLYPDVSKVYEVSVNGTIMVAEYIPPFGSFTEMYKYADKIREKLTKISSVYLIGDVGITGTNFSNWGIRMGTDDPVCLDFAYVYEVSSELFICRDCKVNAMLVPDRDFTELYCSNKACGKHYKFEDIRARIGNDIHRHEIGDLSEEGYILSESNVPTELTESRSNYLARRKEKKEKVKEVEKHVEEDNFVMKPPHMYYGSNNVYDKEEIQMSILDNARSLATGFSGSQWTGVFLNATAKPIEVVANPTNDDDTVIQYAESVLIDEPTEEENADGSDDSGVAFACDIDEDADTDTIDDIVVNSSANVDETEEEEVIEVNAEVIDETVTVKNDPTPNAGNKPSDNQTKEPVKPIDHSSDAGYQTKDGSRFTIRFINNIERAVSKVSNRIGTDLHCRGVFDRVKGHIRDKRMYPETFYKSAQNAVFRSLIQYCGFGEKDELNRNGKGTRKVFIPPVQMDGAHCEPTLVFIERMWNVRDVSMIEDSGECITKYREIFNDYLGIQADWIELFKKRLTSKLPIDKTGVDIICNVILNVWCTTYQEPQEPIENNTEEPENPGVLNEDEMKDLQEAIASTVQEEDAEEETLEGSYSVEDAASEEDSNDNDNEETDEEDEEEEYYEDESEYLSVEIYPEDDFDIVKLKTADAFGSISIPFYCDLNNINVHEGAVSSIVDDRNGIWDWLIHIVPDMMFRTDDPDFWFKINGVYNDETGEMARIVILDYDKDKGYTMGLYYLSGIFVVDDDGNAEPTDDEDLIGRCNRVIREAIGYSTVSHLRRSLTLKELIKDESYIKSLIKNMLLSSNDDETEDEEDEIEEENEETDEEVQQEQQDIHPISEQEAAAIAAMMMSGNNKNNRTTVTEAKDPVHVQDVKPQTSTAPANNDDVMPVIRRRKG